MQKCPACRARYKGESLCARCGADLTLPLLSEQQAEDYLRRAIQLLVNGDPTRAVAEIQQSLLLRQTPLAVSLNAFLNTEMHQSTRAKAKVEEPKIHEPTQVDTLKTGNRLQDWLSISKEKWGNFHPDLSLWKKQVLHWQRKSTP